MHPWSPCAHPAAALGPVWRITNGAIIRNNTGPEICRDLQVVVAIGAACRDTVMIMRSPFPNEAPGLCDKTGAWCQEEDSRRVQEPSSA